MRKNNLTMVLFILIVCGSIFLYQCGSDSPSEPSTPDEETVISDPSFKIVLPGNSTDSWLVMKIEGRQTAGLRMPPSADPLSDVRIQNIKNWVDRGAKDN